MVAIPQQKELWILIKTVFIQGVRWIEAYDGKTGERLEVQMDIDRLFARLKERFELHD